MGTTTLFKMSTKRLQKEFGSFHKDVTWATAEHVGESLYKWHVKVPGPENSAYEGGSFTVSVDIPQEYPFKAPTIKFVTKIYHPNVKTDTGEICQDAILPDDWAPQTRIHEVLNTLRVLLAEPNLRVAARAGHCQRIHR